jgi:8-oxo-dGTP pyrophosphatase MutT (NUDIX family)
MKKVACIAIRHPTEPNLFLHGLRRDNNKWAMPGGHAKPGEISSESAHRELEEETGLKGIKLDQVHQNQYGEHYVTLFTGSPPQEMDLNAQNDPDKEFVTFKYLDPSSHANLHIPKKKNILVEWMNQSLAKNEKADSESERIRENKKKPENMRPHKFVAAEWTHPNGHPRCIKCGDEERTGGMCEPQLSKAQGKFTVEPFTADPIQFNPKKHDFIVRAHKGGKQVGFLAVTHKPQGIMPFNFEVQEQHRRKGWGTALATHAQNISGKKIHHSPDQTPDAKAFAQAFARHNLKKDIYDWQDEILMKSNENPQIANSSILMYPVTLGGSKSRSNGTPFHMTVKTLGDSEKLDHKQIQSIIDQHGFHKPIDEKKMLFMPHKLKGLNGDEHHVLLAYGAPDRIKHVRESLKEFGPSFKHFLPHISIDEKDWNKFSQMGHALTAKEIGLQFHPAELRSGGGVLKTY